MGDSKRIVSWPSPVERFMTLWWYEHVDPENDPGRVNKAVNYTNDLLNDMKGWSCANLRTKHAQKL